MQHYVKDIELGSSKK